MQPLHQQQLHRRSNNTNQQRTTLPFDESPTKSSSQSKTTKQKQQEEIKHISSSSKNSHSLKKYFGFLIICVISFSLLVYSLALIYFDWPPNGTRLNADGSFNPSEGDWWLSPNLTKAFHYMLVVAHPDDESLFFSPTLLNLASPRLVHSTEFDSTLAAKTSSTPSSGHHPTFKVEDPSGHILCLSSGNADGLGFKRTREMKSSCQEFGIPSSKCIVIDDPDLPDSMSAWWAPGKIEAYVRLYVDLWKINVIITFDHQGVSSHANHRAISEAIKGLVQTEPSFPITFMLQSSALIEKYSWLISLPLSLYRHHRQLVREIVTSSSITTDRKKQLRSISKSKFTLSEHGLILSSPRQYLEGRRSFSQHVSQNVWFRRLWLTFSRYMWINELVRVV